MRAELRQGGYQVNVVGINMIGMESTQNLLAGRCTFDLLQDVRTLNSWNQLGGNKDDFFIYREGGSLAPRGYLFAGGMLGTDLSSVQGYQNVREAIVAASDFGRGKLCGDPSEGGWQLPGNVNQDGRVDLSDPILLIGYLFMGLAESLPCEELEFEGRGNLALLDANGDRELDLSDPIHLLTFLFNGGPPAAQGLDCKQMPGCPSACGA